MELGLAFSIYGITAFLSYLPGGYIADKVSPKYLLFSSLLLTSFGGIFYMTNPSINGLYFLFGYWGITTILFFWAALIKATRSIAGNNQGISFEGDIVDLALQADIIQKMGSWFSYGDKKIGQGRENAKQYLIDNEKDRDEIVNKVQSFLGVEKD